MITGLNAIAENARRLLKDAELLFSEGSHATATALAIISIEEAGKHFLLKWSSDHTGVDSAAHAHKTKSGSAHKAKQAILGSFYLSEVAIETIRQYLRKIGFEGNDKSLEDLGNALYFLRDDPVYGPKAKLAEEKIVKLVAEKMAESEHGEFSQNAMQGKVQLIKHRGLYIDLDSSGEVMSGPDQITIEDAQTWLEHARRAVDFLSSSDRSAD